MGTQSSQISFYWMWLWLWLCCGCAVLWLGYARGWYNSESLDSLIGLISVREQCVCKQRRGRGFCLLLLRIESSIP